MALPILAGAVMVSAACTQNSQPPTEPAALIERFFTTLEAGDTTGLMELLDDDFIFRDPDSTFVVPKQAIPGMLAWDIVAGAEPVVGDLHVSGDTVRCEVRETNAFTELLGLDPYVLDLTFLVRDGRIREEVVRERVTDGPSYTQRFNAAIAPVLAWAERNDPDALSRIRGESGMRYDAESARALLDVIRAWRRATTDDGG